MLFGSMRSPHPTPFSVLLLSGVLTALAAGEAHAQIAYSGRGIGVRASIAGGQVQTIADTGELPPTGGDLSDSVVLAEIPGLLSAGVVEAATAKGLKKVGTQEMGDAIVKELDRLV